MASDDEDATGKKDGKRFSQILKSVRNSLVWEKKEPSEIETVVKEYKKQYHKIMKYNVAIKKYFEDLEALKTSNIILINAVTDFYDSDKLDLSQLQRCIAKMLNAYNSYVKSVKTDVLNPTREYASQWESLNARIPKRNLTALDDVSEDGSVVQSASSDTLVGALCEQYDKRPMFLTDCTIELFRLKQLFNAGYASLLKEVDDELDDLTKLHLKSLSFREQLQKARPSDDGRQDDSSCPELQCSSEASFIPATSSNASPKEEKIPIQPNGPLEDSVKFPAEEFDTSSESDLDEDVQRTPDRPLEDDGISSEANSSGCDLQ